MPSDFPRSPKFLKGAMVVFGTPAPVPTNLIVFQYNPETMSRSLQINVDYQNYDPTRSAGDTQFVLPPTETFQVSIELDAADQLENNNPLTLATGLHPTLAALELLTYPESSMLLLNKILSAVGSSMVTPPFLPIVLFIWGPARVVPVRVSSLSITEQAFDQLLNPIQAKVELGLRTLSMQELQDAGAPFSTLAMVQIISKEVLAASNIVNSAQNIRSMLPF